ncbi:MAG: helicase C-terminal domain-containing protein [Gammaproteobacteria bacterium]
MQAHAVLTDSLKAEIQEAYRAWLAARQFRPRRGQREMIAEIARTLTADGERLTVIEAGTGTGKTAAYCLAAIPIGRALGKTVIVSSATVALQEQVVLRDLPDLKARSGLEFNFALAKGRGRYLCLKRLDDRLKYGESAEVPLFEGLIEADPADDGNLYPELLAAFSERRWDGELDSWPESIAAPAWRTVTTDHRGCTNNRCGYFKQCPFFKARAALDGCDVIVANHDLVLADLSLGGGAILPDPDDSIYIVDEAHHLPEKTQQHFSASMRLRSTRLWLDTVQTVIGSMTHRFARPVELVDIATRLADFGARGGEALEGIEGEAQTLSFEPRDENLEISRFKLGEVPEEIAHGAGKALEVFAEFARELDRAHEVLTRVQEGKLEWERGFEAEDWLPALGQLQSRAMAVARLLEAYSGSDAELGMQARWANRYADDVELVRTPIEPGPLLAHAFWSRCHSAVLTSATLTAAGSFARFLERAGLTGRPALRIESPFDFPRLASFSVPPMRSEPGDFQAHTEEVAELLPAEDVAADRQSVLFGLASFAEGVDLPDDLCRHVVIVKLPFSVPDDPLDQAIAEWAESQGRNPFYELSVPDAALKLVQACGRLVRHEEDWGRITLLDRRIVTKRYGRDLLASLPPYRFELAG